MAKQKNTDWKNIDFPADTVTEQNEHDSKGTKKTFNLVVDDVPYVVKTESFSFNDETRFYISLNGGEDHVFTWDSEVGRLRAIDDESATVPDAVEEAVSQKILTWLK
jgi:hypothetical protein